MADDREFPGLEALQQALAAGDMDAVRRRLLELDQDEIRVLETRLGTDNVRRIYRGVRRARRGAAAGKVVVLHGIMGSRLDAVDPRGDTDRIWVNYFRLFAGRIKELRLALDGKPAKPSYRVQLGGLFPEYLPLLTELAERWDVLPFAYDWRADIDRSADELQRRVVEWGGGRPVHLVAHSMGGLVARRFVQRHEQLWRSMADANGLAAGGRLVMLGTPNRGSFAIPLVLSGREKVVRMLEMLDREHDMPELLEILATFGGIYQMLPSAQSGGADDRARLFDKASWGRLRVHDELLARGRALQDALETVSDPERLLYVAGYDQRTPYRIRVDAPGEFSYQETLDGDGRVPHELGLLPGVRTFWVRESHGDLPRNRAVLEGIHDLLQRGTTAALQADRPVRRGRDAEAERWRTGDEIEPIPPEVVSAAMKPVVRGATGSRAAGARGAGGGVAEAEAVADGEEAARLEAVLLRDYLGGPGTRELGARVAAEAGAAAGAPAGAEGDGEAARANGAGRRGARRDDGAAAAAPELAVEVWWSDVTEVPGDVHAVGHYENVLPQNAELALDRAVSGKGASGRDLVLTSLTRRGILRGALGNVEFFPWAQGAGAGKLVAVAGMGHPGRFGEAELRRLSRNLAWAVTALPDATTVCTVLIGAGVGNLTVPDAVRQLVGGVVDGLGEITRRTVRRVRIVENELGRARQILGALRAYAQEPATRKRIDLQLEEDVRTGKGGTIGHEYCLSLTLAAAAGAASGAATAPQRRALDAMLALVPDPEAFRDRALASLGHVSKHALERLGEAAGRGLRPADVAGLVRVELNEERAATETPTRLSFVREADGIAVAALTDTAVIPERVHGFDPGLLEEAVAEMVDPESDRLPGLALSLHRLLVPQEFRQVLAGAEATVIECDRAMAKVHWEMLPRSVEDGGARALALEVPLSRQLRTTYSPPPGVARAPRPRLRALVVGDPGDPDAGESLPGAREEALEVAELLRAKGLTVELMVGAAADRRDQRPGAAKPARRLDVLRALMEGEFDLLHYAGHGDFDPREPQRTGWVFKGGLLTARELERIDLAPSLVVANACLSARTSDAGADGAAAGRRRDEADLLPGLADEFFRRGVRNYVGTAWEVSDVGAVKFARAFYDALIPDQGEAPGPQHTVGAALLAARKALHEEQARFGALWAAYQHYGDPGHSVVPEPAAPAAGAAGDGGGSNGAGRNGRASDRAPRGGRAAGKRPAAAKTRGGGRPATRRPASTRRSR